MFKHRNPERYCYFFNILNLDISFNIMFRVMGLLVFYTKYFKFKKEWLNLFINYLNLVTKPMAIFFILEWTTLL